MAARLLCVAALVSGVSAEAVELTSDNYESLVTNTGKAAFVKFQAPW